MHAHTASLVQPRSLAAVGALIALLSLAVAPRATALPRSSEAIVGDFRLQALSPTLLRAEAKGPIGFEDRETFTASNRSGFGGIPISKTEKMPSGATRLTTAHYAVEVLTTATVADSTPGPTRLPLTGASDFLVDGGAAVESDGITWVRSGVPHSSSTAKITTTLKPGAVVNAVSLSYRYCTGYGGEPGANFSLAVAGTPVYASPMLTDWPYKKGSSPSIYSPPKQIAVSGLGITVPSSGSSYIEFEFEDGAMNLQLLLPMTITIECAGGSCMTPQTKTQVSVLHPNGTVLTTIDDIGNVPCALDFPKPAVGFSDANPTWTVRDAPRFVPNPSGVVPDNVSSPHFPAALANTSGFDLGTDALDIYIFLPAVGGGSYGYTGLRSEFLQLTGAIPPLPDAAFGTWFSWYHPYNQSGAEADIERWRNDDLPIDIWGLDMDWRIWQNGKEGKGYFINTKLFPDMAGFYNFAHRHGLSVYMNDHPMAKADQLSQEEVAFRYDGLTSLFDLGLDFWWYDENWHDIIPGLAFNGACGHDPTSPTCVDHLIWGQEIFRSVTARYNQLHGPRNKTVPFGTLSLSMFSSNHPAEHRFPVWWTGDVHYTMLLQNIQQMVNGGLDLQPYVHPDCGAHYGVPFKEETPEMFVRWAQFCAMGTIIRFHTNSCCDHRPWTWGADAEAAIQKILKLRYSLMPTLIAAGRRATADGTPVVQRLDLTWPERAGDGAARDDQYLFADGTMLVAPIIPFNGSSPVAKNPTNGPGNASRSVWVPPGAWQDGWTGAQVSGPRTIQVTDCPMDQIPLWHRKGSVLVSTAPGGSTSEQDWDALAAEVFPFPLLADEGVPPAVRSSTSIFFDTKADHAAPPQTLLTLEQAASNGSATLRIGRGPSSRAWRVRIHLPAGAGEEITALQLQRGNGPLVDLAFISPAALVNSTNPPIGGTGSVVVEAVVHSLANHDQTVHFEVARR